MSFYNKFKESQWPRAGAHDLKSRARSPHGWITIMQQALCPPQDLSQVKFHADYKKSFRWDHNSRSTVNICMKKDCGRMWNILYSMSEFAGIWKHQNNPAYTKASDSSICWSWTIYGRRRRRLKTKRRVRRVQEQWGTPKRNVKGDSRQSSIMHPINQNGIWQLDSQQFNFLFVRFMVYFVTNRCLKVLKTQPEQSRFPSGKRTPGEAALSALSIGMKYNK